MKRLIIFLILALFCSTANADVVGNTYNKAEIDLILEDTSTTLPDTLSKVLSEVKEIEHHLHNDEHWYFARDVDADSTNYAIAIDNDSTSVMGGDLAISPMRLTSGTDTVGSWKVILGSLDTPASAGKKFWDMHRIVFEDVESSKKMVWIEFAFGLSTPELALATNKYYTQVLASPEKDGKFSPVDVICPRIPVGYYAWARCWVKGEDTKWVDIAIGIHEYDN